MTKPQKDNALYLHLRSLINEVLPMEYAIRAAKQANPHELARLSEIDSRIRQYWVELGATEAEIDGELLMDFAWDTIQVGVPRARRHGRLYPDREFLNLIYQGLMGVDAIFGAEVRQLAIPAMRYFRICDLLNANDILRLLQATARTLEDAGDYLPADEIELEKFIRGIREPIHLHPGVQFTDWEWPEGEPTAKGFGIWLDVEMEFTMPELERQIREFLYQFAARRQSICMGDHISSKLIDEFLKDELLGRINKHKVQRHDGFTSLLSGLYCWDLVQKYREEKRKSPIDEAIVATQDVYPKNIREVGEDAIRKNYNTVREAINKVSFDVTKMRP